MQRGVAWGIFLVTLSDFPCRRAGEKLAERASGKVHVSCTQTWGAGC